MSHLEGRRTLLIAPKQGFGAKKSKISNVNISGVYEAICKKSCNLISLIIGKVEGFVSQQQSMCVCMCVCVCVFFFFFLRIQIAITDEFTTQLARILQSHSPSLKYSRWSWREFSHCTEGGVLGQGVQTVKNHWEGKKNKIAQLWTCNWKVTG